MKTISTSILKFALPLFILFIAGTAANAQSYTQQEQTCYNMVQGKVAYDRAGNNRWNDDNIRALCKGTTDPAARVQCFKTSISAFDDWQRGIRECAAKPDLPSLAGTWTQYKGDGSSAGTGKIGSTMADAGVADGAPYVKIKFAEEPIDLTFAIYGNAIMGLDSDRKGQLSTDGKRINWLDGTYWTKGAAALSNPKPSGVFETVTGSATDIDIGRNGTVWRVGNILQPIGGYVGVSKLNNTNWEGLEGNALRVAVNSYGDPWIVLAGGQIMRRIGNYWKTMPTPGAVDIAIGGPNGEIWIIDKGGYARRWKNNGWNDVWWVDGSRIAVDDNGEAWVATKKGGITKFDGTNWKTMPGSGAILIAARAKSVYMVTGDQYLAKWDGSTWQKVADGPFFEIAVDNKGMPWGINPNGDILKDTNSKANVLVPRVTNNPYDSYWCLTESYNFFRGNVIDLTQDVAQRQALETWALPNLNSMCSQRGSYQTVPTCFKDNYNKNHDKDKAIRDCRVHAIID